MPVPATEQVSHWVSRSDLLIARSGVQRLGPAAGRRPEEPRTPRLLLQAFMSGRFSGVIDVFERALWGLG